jgi:hypothetical protein
MATKAQIERAKLTANYFNSLAIGLGLGGVLIPFLTLAQHMNEIIVHLEDGRAFRFPDLFIGAGTILAIGLALHGGAYLRRAANQALAILDDEADCRA